MAPVVAVVVSVVACLACPARGVMSNRFVKDGGRQLSRAVLSVTAVSPLSCCLQCDRLEGCVAASFSRDSNTCRLSSDVSCAESSGSYDVYYRKDMATFYNAYKHVCYEVLAGSFTWEDGRHACIAQDSHLADIDSDYENSVIREIVDQSGHQWEKFWIGMYVTALGARSWTSGRPVTYENFRSGEPNNIYENCVEMESNGEWNDNWCLLSKLTVCEKLIT